MADFFEDRRGTIRDIIPGPLDQVTEIFTKAGAIRGNHIHRETIQWTYVISGTMLFASTEDDGLHEREAYPGDLVKEPAGIAHAWKAVTDARVLVFTRGPRSGEGYESDTHRLEKPIYE